MAIKIPQTAYESEKDSISKNSLENRLNNLLLTTKDLSLKLNGKLIINYFNESMMVWMKLWISNDETQQKKLVQIDTMPASEELIQALIDVIFNDLEDLKKIIPTLDNAPILKENKCDEYCFDFMGTNLKRKKSYGTQINGVPQISCEFYVPEKDNYSSTITVMVLDNEINRTSLAGFYDGSDNAIHI